MDFLILGGCFLLMIVFFSLGLISTKEEQQLEQRIHELTHLEEKKPLTTRKKALENSFTHRVIFPIAQNFFDKTQALIPLSNKSWVRGKLIQAGYQKSHYQKIFLGIQLLTTCILLGSFLTIVTLFAKVDLFTGIMVSIVFALMGYMLPMLWLIQQAGRRQKSIQKGLADFLDLLVICVEAGLGLDSAFNKLANLKSVKTSEYLREELLHYIKDVNLGKPRKQALLDMADRTGVDDLGVIINALVQSYEMGTSVAHTLRVQAETLRVKRLQKAEEKANKIPVKMILPIYIFLFPSIFVSIFGPMGMILMKAAASIFSKKIGE